MITFEAPVEFKTDTLKNSPNEPEMTDIAAAFTSSLVAVVATVSSTGRPERRKRTMFRGNHPTRVDEKGRLKVPAEFKRVIDEKYGSNSTSQVSTGRLLKYIPSRNGSGSSRSWQRSPLSILRRRSF